MSDKIKQTHWHAVEVLSPDQLGDVAIEFINHQGELRSGYVSPDTLIPIADDAEREKVIEGLELIVCDYHGHHDPAGVLTAAITFLRQPQATGAEFKEGDTVTLDGDGKYELIAKMWEVKDLNSGRQQSQVTELFECDIAKYEPAPRPPITIGGKELDTTYLTPDELGLLDSIINKQESEETK